VDYLIFLIFLIIDLIDSIYIYTYNIYDYIFIIIIFSFLHFLQTISWGTLLSKRFWFSDGTWPGKVVLEGLGPTAWLRCWDAESVWISYSKTVGIIMIHYLRGVNFIEFRMNFIWILWILWNLLVFGKPKLCHIVSTSSRRSCPCGSKRILWSFSTELDCHDRSCLVTRYEADSQFTWFVCYV